VWWRIQQIHVVTYNPECLTLYCLDGALHGARHMYLLNASLHTPSILILFYYPTVNFNHKLFCFEYCRVLLTHLITTVFLNQRNCPEDGRITGRNMWPYYDKIISILLKCICWSLTHFMHGIWNISNCYFFVIRTSRWLYFRGKDLTFVTCSYYELLLYLPLFAKPEHAQLPAMRHLCIGKTGRQKIIPLRKCTREVHEIDCDNGRSDQPSILCATVRVCHLPNVTRLSIVDL